MMKISDWKVEQLMLGVLSEEEARAVRARLEADGDPRVDALARSNAEILADYPPPSMAAKIRTRLEGTQASPRGKVGWWVGLSVGMAAVALAAWWVVRAPEARKASSPEVAVAEHGRSEHVRLKGEEALLVYRQVGAGREQLQRDARVAPGDVLQLAYRAAGSQHGVIVSWDGRQSVTLHFPASKAASTHLRQGGAVALEHGYALDDAPSFERFVFVTSAEPIDVERVRRAAQATARGEHPVDADMTLPPVYKQQSFVVRKVPSR